MSTKLAILPSKDGFGYDIHCFVPSTMTKERLDIALNACRKQAAEDNGEEWTADDLRPLLLNQGIVMLPAKDILISSENWDENHAS